MKKYLIIALLVFVPLLIIVLTLLFIKEGEAKKTATEVEAFLTKKGKLIVTDFYELGEVESIFGGKVVFTALVIYERGKESQRIRGLRIEVTQGDKYERSHASFLDLEEIESLSKALGYMDNLSAKWHGIRKEFTEVIFSTKNDFEIGFFQKGIEQRAFASSGSIAKASYLFSSMEDLSSVKTIIDKGLKLLNEK